MQLAHVAELSPQDFDLLASALVETGLEKTLPQLLAQLDIGQYQLWRLEGVSTNVLVVTAIKNEVASRELFIYLIAGFGWINFLEEIEPELAKICKYKDCQFIAGIARNAAMERVYDRYGAKRAGVIFRKAIA